MQDIGIILIVILILVLLWRGPKTLPQLGNALGRGVREARDEASKAQAEIQARTTDEPAEAGAGTPAAPATTAETETPERPREDRPPTDRTPPDAA